MQYPYSQPQYTNQFNYNYLSIKQTLEQYLLQQQVKSLNKHKQLLYQKMNSFNTYLLTSDLSSTILESKTPTENKRLIEVEPPLSTRQECLARYRAKKRLLINRTLYGVRKEIADRRLRYNGQFLNGDEEQKIIRVHKLVGNHYLRVKNNNVKIMGQGKVHLSKEKALSKLKKLMPPEIKKRIQNQQQLFKIL